MFFRRRKDGRRSGAILLVMAALVTSILLVINRVLALSLYAVLVPKTLDQPKVRAIVSVLAMLGLLLPEWWLVDWAIGKLKSLYRRIEGGQCETNR